jgi:hypothetical protein
VTVEGCSPARLSFGRRWGCFGHLAGSRWRAAAGSASCDPGVLELGHELGRALVVAARQQLDRFVVGEGLDRAVEPDRDVVGAARWAVGELRPLSQSRTVLALAPVAAAPAGLCQPIVNQPQQTAVEAAPAGRAT